MVFIPAYKKNLTAGALDEKAAALAEHLIKCDICPRNCGVNRWDGEIGICGIAEACLDKQLWSASWRGGSYSRHPWFRDDLFQRL